MDFAVCNGDISATQYRRQRCQPGNVTAGVKDAGISPQKTAQLLLELHMQIAHPEENWRTTSSGTVFQQGSPRGSNRVPMYAETKVIVRSEIDNRPDCSVEIHADPCSCGGMQPRLIKAHFLRGS